MKAGWEVKLFEQCILPVTYTAKVQRKDFLSSGRFPIISQEEAFTNGFWDQERDLFRVDNPIVVFGDHTKAIKYVDFDFVLGADGVKILRPQPFLDPKYFYYHLGNFELRSLGYARHYRLLKEQSLVVPPLAEQRRIVEVLDEAFAGLATATAYAEQTVVNAREFSREFLGRLFDRGDWRQIRLGDCSALITKGTTPTSIGHKFINEGINFIKVESLTPKGEILPGKTAAISAECHVALKRSQLAENDVLFSIAGALGRTALVPSDVLPANTNQALAIIRLEPSALMLPEFLRLALTSSFIADQVSSGQGGAAQQNLSLRQVSDFLLPRPSVSDQRQIVARYMTMEEQMNGLTMLIRQKLALLAELKQSLLHRAFTGQLV